MRDKLDFPKSDHICSEDIFLNSFSLWTPLKQCVLMVSAPSSFGSVPIHVEPQLFHCFSGVLPTVIFLRNRNSLDLSYFERWWFKREKLQTNFSSVYTIKSLRKFILNFLAKFIFPILSPLQFDFVQRRSSQKQLLVTSSNIFNNTCCKSPTDIIYLDFKKAFYSVSHGDHLSKLWSMHFVDSEWLKDHLTNRVQMTSIEAYSFFPTSWYFWFPLGKYP